MKNNCLFIFDRPTESHEEVLSKLDDFFRELSSTHYVYVADPCCEEICDSPGGARFLPWNERLLDAFGDLSSVVVVDSDELHKDLRSRLPSSVQLVSIHLSDGIEKPIRHIAERILSVPSQIYDSRRTKAA